MPISLARSILFITSLVARQDPDLFGHIRIPGLWTELLDDEL